MAYGFHHVHIKAPDPRKTADWFVKAFDFKINSDNVRVWGDRFIMAETADGTNIMISGARNNEKMGDGDAGAHWGIEHIGISVDDLNSEIDRLSGLGAKFIEGPIHVPNGPKIAFVEGPDAVRIELLQF